MSLIRARVQELDVWYGLGLYGFKADLFMGMGRVLESIKAGKRLPEARFSNLSTAAQGQKSVYGMLKKEKSTGDDERR